MVLSVSPDRLATTLAPRCDCCLACANGCWGVAETPLLLVVIGLGHATNAVGARAILATLSACCVAKQVAATAAAMATNTPFDDLQILGWRANEA